MDEGGTGQAYNEQGSGGDIDRGDTEVVGTYPSVDGWTDAGHCQNQFREAGLLQPVGGHLG